MCRHPQPQNQTVLTPLTVPSRRNECSTNANILTRMSHQPIRLHRHHHHHHCYMPTIPFRSRTRYLGDSIRTPSYRHRKWVSLWRDQTTNSTSSTYWAPRVAKSSSMWSMWRPSTNWILGVHRNAISCCWLITSPSTPSTSYYNHHHHN